MSSFVEILGCEGSVLYENDNHNVNFTTSGRLEILIAYDGMVMLKLNDFEYTIKQSDVITCDQTDPQFKMIFYLRKYPTGKWVLKINEHFDEVYSCLSEKCHIVDKVEEKKQFSSDYSSYTNRVQEDDDKCKQEGKKKKEKMNNKQKKKQKTTEKTEKVEVEVTDDHDGESHQNHKITAGTVLVSASKGLGWGLKLTGKVLSKGFEAVGSLASKAVKPATQKVQISQNAKANIELAKKTSKSVLGFAASQVGNLFKFGKEAASNIGQRFQKSQKGKQLQQNPRYETIKQGTKTGVQVVSNIYDGVINAVYEIGSGIGKGTSKVIGTKYGDQAGQAADDVFEGVGNVVKISRVPQDEAYKAFK